MSTSKLQDEVGRLLNRAFPEYRIRENHKPEWLISSDGARLELDFFVEEIGVALEIQGEQHFGFVEFFHKTRDNYETAMKRDADKKDLCYGRGVSLFEITSMQEAKEIVERYLPKRNHSQIQQRILSEIRSMEWASNNCKKKKLHKDIALYISNQDIVDDLSEELMIYYSQNRKDIDRRIKLPTVHQRS